MKKLISSLLILFLEIILLLGCSNTASIEDNTYDEELAKLVPIETNKEYIYNGYAEYCHIATINNIDKTKEALVVSGKATIFSSTVKDRENRWFEFKYIIDTNSIREIIKNHDPCREDANSEVLNSIIPNQIILQAPLIKGNKWNQTFIYKDKEYTAVTEIISVLNKHKRLEIETKTTVENIDGFFNNFYEETRLYREGEGLVRFKNYMPMYKLEKDNREYDREDFIFGYILSIME